MISICTTFDENYFRWGYPLICSIFLNYPTEIYVNSINLSSRHIKQLKKLGIRLLVNYKPNDEKFSFECFASKAETVLFALKQTKQSAVAFIDADSLLEGSLDSFENKFVNFDFCVTKRDRGKEHLVFCSNNVVIRKNETCIRMVEEWISMIPKWKTDLPISLSYAEQACLYLSYEKYKSHIKLLNALDADLPIFHAKGCKYPNHKDFNIFNYDKRCNEIIDRFKKSRKNV